jgi:phenylacetate-CoA ligase
MNSVIENIYSCSPVFLQNLMVCGYGYKLFRERYHGNHDLYVEKLLRSQWYDESKIRKLIEDRFINMVGHAIKNVPFYRDLVKCEKINPVNINGIQDIKQFPIIKKEEIRENPEYYLAEGFNKKDLIVVNTSGTTGKTLKIFIDKDSRRNAYAFFTRFKQWAGIQGWPPNVTFAGRTIVPSETCRPPYWRKNAAMNNHLFSSYHLSSLNLKYYVMMLQKIQPYFIDSYPSSIFIIAKYMEENGLCGVWPKAIITSSETLFEYQRKIIEKVFGCTVYDQYGAAEQVVFVSQCEKGSYHVNPEFGIVEFIRENGSEALPGEPARMICTGFTNRAMPLMRYDIGDVGVLSVDKCTCGRNFPVIRQILGRNDDILIGLDGRQVGRLDPIFKGLQTIKEAQIIQEDYNNIIVKVVPGEGFNQSDSQVLIKELKKRLGSKIDVTVNLVNYIPRTSAGKLRAVISKVRKRS